MPSEAWLDPSSSGTLTPAVAGILSGAALDTSAHATAEDGAQSHQHQLGTVDAVQTAIATADAPQQDSLATISRQHH